MMSILLELALLFNLLLTVTVYAAPSSISVSGDVDSGSSITISGSDFGAHADYHANNTGQLTWLWQDFETSLADDGLEYNPGGDSSAYWTRTTTGGRSGYMARRSGSGNTQYFQTSHDTITTGVFFLSYWQYIPADSVDGKTVRLAFSGWGDVDYWWNMSSGNVASDVPSSFTSWSAVAERTQGVWQRVDVLLTGASGATSQTFRILGVNGNAPVHSDTSAGIQIRDTVQLMLGAGYDSTTGYWGFDDVYANFTQARVEICDSASWNARSTCEIQIPSAWSSSSITATVNTGAFTNNSTAYLYVVDENGDANATGYEVTIGESSTPTPIDGVCGSSDGGSFASAPTINLCTTGMASAVSGTTSFSWTCEGINGSDVDDSCSASLASGSVSAWLTSGGSILTSGGAVLTPAQ